MTTDKKKNKIQRARIEDAKIKIMGNGFGFYVKKALVEDNVLEAGKRYELVVNELVNEGVVWGFSTPKQAVLA